MIKLVDRPSMGEHTVVLASYRWMRENAEHLDEFTLCVFDEAHLLKNAHHTRDKDCSLRYLAARRLASRLKFTLFLTGTPTPNCPKELYSLLYLVGAVHMKYAEFAFRYCKRYFSRLFFGWHDDGVSAKEELKALQRMHFVRRLAADHLRGLPEEMRSFVTLPLQGGKAKLKKHAKERETLLKKLNDPSLTDADRKNTSKRVQFNRTMQLIASAQAKNKSFKQYFMQYLKDHPPRSDGTRTPFIVFAYHEETLLALQTLFQELEIVPGLVYGKTPKSEAGDIIRAFQANEIEVLILSLAMSAGLNLQNCNTAFFAEVTWSPGVLAQAEKRVHRQGSAHDRVHYVYLFGESPAICQQVYNKCTRKKRNIEQSLQKESKKHRPDQPE
jgi:SWI/SNF-related matrix-associated actin-dependent regulator 1 of chromatin subfamily A